MPGPDPSALWIERYEDNTVSVMFQAYYGTGNSGNRRRRATAIIRRIARGSWRCLWCREDIPDWRRADAEYCCEGCRKRAAKHRRLTWGDPRLCGRGGDDRG